MRKPRVILEGYSYLEGPRWHEGRLWLSDFYTHRVLSVRSDGSDVRVEAEVEGQPSGLGWLPDGRLLVVSMCDQRLLRRETDGMLVEHADLSAYATGHLNDMSSEEEVVCPDDLTPLAPIFRQVRCETLTAQPDRWHG